MKTKNTFYNSIASLFYYFSTIILGVLNRKAVILFLGIEYQGINGYLVIYYPCYQLQNWELVLQLFFIYMAL